ncbi:recombinase family protein [Brevibacterium sp. CT2-23B]|uniref:recombinase family protein n=1 Tax=Brevibacterium sp. CT2-23B TaxID=2729630 RepID=UPI0015538378|nr:recombinase family protein [Brevibacterium sp. CT2-23B]
MKGQAVAYVRVSSIDQNTARQLEAVGEVDRVFSEKVSGGSRDGREQLAEMIAYVRDGDTVIVASMDRLGRDVDDLKSIIRELNGKGVNVHLKKEGLRFVVNGEESDKAMTDLMLHLLGGVAQFERARIRERQQEGIEIAKAQGKFAKAKKLSDEQIAEARQRIAEGAAKAEIARDLGVSRQTLYTALKSA